VALSQTKFRSAVDSRGDVIAWGEEVMRGEGAVRGRDLKSDDPSVDVDRNLNLDFKPLALFRLD
jgi:hypothetical protein